MAWNILGKHPGLGGDTLDRQVDIGLIAEKPVSISIFSNGATPS
jgi:hypothetical protein